MSKWVNCPKRLMIIDREKLSHRGTPPLTFAVTSRIVLHFWKDAWFVHNRSAQFTRVIRVIVVIRSLKSFDEQHTHHKHTHIHTYTYKYTYTHTHIHTQAHKHTSTWFSGFNPIIMINVRPSLMMYSHIWDLSKFLQNQCPKVVGSLRLVFLWPYLGRFQFWEELPHYKYVT